MWTGHMDVFRIGCLAQSSTLQQHRTVAMFLWQYCKAVEERGDGGVDALSCATKPCDWNP